VKLQIPGAPHLTYCTNIHPGETWDEVRANLERHVLAVKARVAPDRRFGIGLRLSARAAETLAAPDRLAELQGFLAAHECYVFTINGFPYGAFHAVRVKEAVYEPDWRDARRLAYTDRLATLLAALLPGEHGLYGSVSTVPGAFRPRARSAEDAATIAERLLRHAVRLMALEAETGRSIRLALEPEPWCVLETVADAVAYFAAHLHSRDAVDRLAALAGRTRADAEAALHRLIGVCLDACHLAVEFADPGDALAQLEAAGIAIVKVQVSAGMAATLGGDDAATRGALAAFADDVYLHQVVERRDGELRRFVDLPEALAAAAGDVTPREWRVHFHVPLFREDLGALRSTQPWVAALLRQLAARGYDGHLEVETYTWDVLPEAYRAEPVATAVARELAWTMEQLAT
jgi:sugar phosphate isomerase/epimerase